MYSLDARRRLLTNDPVGSAEYTQALAEKQQRLDEVTGALSSVESDLLDEMFDEPRGDYLDLGKLSFQLLAGGPLAGFGQAFRNWAFATALNGGFQDGHDQFEDLIQLNLVDWSDTQRAILEAAERLLASDVSTTGQWALVYLLRATGAAADAAQAETIAEDLTRDREKMTGWRSIERCCDTDPCDPNSEEPGNIGATAEQSEALDVSKLRGSRNYTMEDHSFDEAMTGLARFSPDVAIQTMRRFADDVLTRSADQGRIAMFFLDNQTAALDDAYGPKLVDWAHSAAADAIANGDAHNETFMASQFALVTAFPHLSGDRQLAALSDLAHSPTLLLPLCYAMTPCDPTVLESAIEAAYAGDDAMQQFRLLTFALYSRSTLSDRVRALVGEFVTSPDNLVRLAALGVAANRVDAALDGVVANSGWTAASLDRQKASFEITYGSIILVRAAKSQLISVKDCLERIGFRSYGILLREFGATIAATIADRLDAALKKAAGFVVTQAIPDIEFRSHLDTQPDTYNLEERQGEARSLEEQMDKMSESSDAFYERHERYSAAFKAFERDLTQAGANLIIEMATSEFLGDLFAILPDRLHQWKAWLLELDTPALNRVHNVALVIAQVTAAGDADGAVALFKRLQDSEPFVKVVVGLAKAPLSSIAIWAAADSDPIKSLSFSQLDKAPNDDALATQVLCAIRAKKQHLLKEYVVDRRCRSEPAHKARALMVAGFSEGEDWAVETLNTHKSDRGMLGEAFEEAKYALDRFQWSKTWGRKMREANSQTDLWRYSILLSKIVDGRFLIPLELGHSNSPLLVRYGSTFDDPIRRRIEKWKKRREGRLFGTAAPSSQFLPP